ncbi:myb-like protein D [Hylaeus anthracinus]|uniref:myb-like protein D n=1 Tax=Hylaeus anthracinus TaxID=313031 RepID=UPI0023BA1019|nr:myb-like protein D [Hylaeus anthracinus]
MSSNDGVQTRYATTNAAPYTIYELETMAEHVKQREERVRKLERQIEIDRHTLEKQINDQQACIDQGKDATILEHTDILKQLTLVVQKLSNDMKDLKNQSAIPERTPSREGLTYEDPVNDQRLSTDPTPLDSNSPGIHKRVKEATDGIQNFDDIVDEQSRFRQNYNLNYDRRQDYRPKQYERQDKPRFDYNNQDRPRPNNNNNNNYNCNNYNGNPERPRPNYNNLNYNNNNNFGNNRDNRLNYGERFGSTNTNTRSNSYSNQSARPPDKQCRYCKTSGHTIKECRKLQARRQYEQNQSKAEEARVNTIQQTCTDSPIQSERRSREPTSRRAPNNDAKSRTILLSLKAKNQTSSINVPVGQNLTTSKPIQSVAHRIMAKMGYVPGEGLGKHNQGRTSPIECTPKNNKRGFGYINSGKVNGPPQARAGPIV